MKSTKKIVIFGLVMTIIIAISTFTSISGAISKISTTNYLDYMSRSLQNITENNSWQNNSQNGLHNESSGPCENCSQDPSQNMTDDFWQNNSQDPSQNSSEDCFVSGTGIIVFGTYGDHGNSSYYGIAPDNGTIIKYGGIYYPIRVLPKEFEIEGLRVRFKAKIVESYFMPHPSVIMIEILELEKIS